MRASESSAGHAAALVTILIWGTTFISTKVLLRLLSPIEILFLRFALGYLALWLACPRPLRAVPRKQELWFAEAGLCGVTLYYLLENVALTFTLASHVGVIISIAPFFTALLETLLQGAARPGPRFFLGFALAMAGICLISLRGGEYAAGLAGDLLSVGAALLWAAYSLLTRKLSGFGYSTLQTTRRTFFYGLLFMLPCLAPMDFAPPLARLARPEYLGNLLFLGLGASALCFVTWNLAVRRLGSVRTSVYIYLVPVITAVCSAVFLGEALSPAALGGIVLTLAGLFLSQSQKRPAPSPSP